MPINSKPVSIHPSSFTADLPDLSKFSLEEVVARFKDVEKKRNKDAEPEGEKEVFLSIRHAPVELISSLNVAVEHLGSQSRSVLTKCMSRQVMDWYDNNADLVALTASYKEIYAKVKKRGYTVLRVQAENPPKFSFFQQPETVNVSISTIQWVLAKLRDVHNVIGMSVPDLLLAGFCWSFTTLENCDWDSENIGRLFQPEADNVSVILKCRTVDVKSLFTKFQMFEEFRVSKK